MMKFVTESCQDSCPQLKYTFKNGVFLKYINFCTAHLLLYV